MTNSEKVWFLIMNMFSKVWQCAVAASMIAAPLAMAKVTIYLCGDSTMQDWATGYYPKQGQGQDFHYWFDVNKAAVVNRGQGGMSLGGGGKDKSGGVAVGYYDMFFKKGCSNGNCIADKLQAGDYVVIQFGINDVSYSTEDFFRSNMKKMVDDVRAKGANPIIMSPIRRCYYDSPTAIHNSYRGYPALSKTLAEEYDVPFIDMSEMVANYMISVGERYAQQFVFNSATSAEYSNLKGDQADQVHLQMNGANAFGRIITEQMRAHKDPVVKKLGDYMAPMYQVDVKVSPEGAAEATSINAYYPQGNSTWTEDVKRNYGGTLTWYAYVMVDAPVITGELVDGYPVISWEAVPSAVSYEVYRSDFPQRAFFKYKTTTDTSYVNSTRIENYRTYYYKILALDAAGNASEYSNIVSVRVIPAGASAPKITVQPFSRAAEAGAAVTYTTAAEGDGLSFQWYSKSPASTAWTKIPNAREESYTLTAAAAYDGFRYRCEVSNFVGSVYSDEALLVLPGEPDFVLPGALTAIEGEAFAGGAFRYVRAGGALTAIGSKAFTGCPNLLYIALPQTVESIAKDAFDSTGVLTIIGARGSCAETFAKENGFSFAVK